MDQQQLEMLATRKVYVFYLYLIISESSSILLIIRILLLPILLLSFICLLTFVSVLLHHDVYQTIQLHLQNDSKC
jgi:hypothetical protein